MDDRDLRPRHHRNMRFARTENIILTTLAIGFAVLVWGGKIALLWQLISRIF